jgi:hypothetical protein
VGANGFFSHKTPQKAPKRLWLDTAKRLFWVSGHSGTCTGSFGVFEPVLTSPAHAAPSLDMPPIGIEVV